MIYNMSYWQRELGRVAQRLRRHATQRRWRDASDASVEKCLMLGFYRVRKILDAFQPPPNLPTMVPVTSFPRTGTRLSPIGWPEFAEAFDLTKATSEQIALRDLCNQVIHSYFFSSWIGPDGHLRGAFCCSDKQKNRKVYRVGIEQAIALLEAIGRSRKTYASLSHFYPRHNRVLMRGRRIPHFRRRETRAADFDIRLWRLTDDGFQG